MRQAVVLVGTLVLLAGCGSASSIDGRATVATSESRDPTPYSGPMTAEQSFADRATVMERSGAAGLALECVGRPYQGGGGDYSDGLESVQGSPTQALQNWLESEGWGQLPSSPYAVERDDGDRVLLSYDVDESTKVAFVAADGVRDYEDDEGWGIESWAACDPAELPASVTDSLGIEVWANAEGARAPISRIQSYRGPEHCDWQDITFLVLDQGSAEGGSDDGETYVRDPGGDLEGLLRTTYDPRSKLPRDAVGTGLHRDGRQLWLVPSQQAAYLVSTADSADVERWPAAKDSIACA